MRTRSRPRGGSPARRGSSPGESCGTALVAALTVARELTATDGRPATRSIVVVLPDGGRNYLSKLYDDEWMRKNGLLGPRAGRERVRARARRTPPRRRAATAGHPGADDASSWRRSSRRSSDYGISQMPVTERDDDAIEGIVGSLNERSLLERAFRDPSVVERTVGEVMERPLPTIDRRRLARRRVHGALGRRTGARRRREGRAGGLVTKLDLLEYLAHQPRDRGSG